MVEPLLKDAVLRIGEVSGIEGRRVFVLVDRNKNSSDLLLDGEIVKNVAVGAYVEIRKGFLSIIGKAEGEKLQEDIGPRKAAVGGAYQSLDKNKRVLTLSLCGYIGPDGKFMGGIKELPLIGNEAYVLTDTKIHTIHSLLKEPEALSIRIAETAIEEVPVDLPVDGLFNSHIAIFGNTGSGKSNTLASLYQELFRVLNRRPQFKQNCRFLVLDFNGEYTREACLTTEKTVYNLTTREDSDTGIPISMDDLLDVETLAVLVEATEKTQKPFLKRTLRFYKNAKDKGHYPEYLKAILRNKLKDVLQMANKEIAFRLLDYMGEILRPFVTEEDRRDLQSDIEFHNTSSSFRLRGTTRYFNDNDADAAIATTKLAAAIESITAEMVNDLPELDQFRLFLHLQLAIDLYQYKVQNDHIYPVINRFIAKQRSIARTFKISATPNFWGPHNVVVVNLRDVNLDMRKTIPLLLGKNVYNAHKTEGNKKSLNIIVDEAHNILSKESFRETEEWKDYRLETFEEIIKEGRKFGVFVTIASQRPNDISETIISQAHNYFIHQLINQKDLFTIGKAVSYIDKITEESIPTLAVGTCIFSGVATPMPLKLRIRKLPLAQQPSSHTLQFSTLWSLSGPLGTAAEDK